MRMPTQSQLSKFDEVDRLSDRPALRFRERKRLEREAKRQKEGQLAIRRKLRYEEKRDLDASRRWDEGMRRFGLPKLDPQALQRYRERAKELHKRYGIALPKEEADALRALLNDEVVDSERGSSAEESKPSGADYDSGQPSTPD
jgi:hypothetical protein